MGEHDRVLGKLRSPLGVRGCRWLRCSPGCSTVPRAGQQRVLLITHRITGGEEIAGRGPSARAGQFPVMDDKHKGFSFLHIQTPRSTMPRSYYKFPGKVPVGRLSPAALLCAAVGIYFLIFLLMSLQVFCNSLTHCWVPGSCTPTRSAARPKPGLPRESWGDHLHGGASQVIPANGSPGLHVGPTLLPFLLRLEPFESTGRPGKHSRVCVSHTGLRLQRGWIEQLWLSTSELLFP